MQYRFHNDKHDDGDDEHNRSILWTFHDIMQQQYQTSVYIEVELVNNK